MWGVVEAGLVLDAREPLVDLLAEQNERALHYRCGAPVLLMVENNAAAVEAALCAGGLVCPGCGGVLDPWAWARPRSIRIHGGQVTVQPRRSRCGRCLATHVLLPTMCLLRRRDGVEQIGSALLALGMGESHRAIAASLGVPASILRGWLRRFAAQATFLAAQFVAVARRLDASLGHIAPRGSPVGDALEAFGVAAAAAVAGSVLACAGGSCRALRAWRASDSADFVGEEPVAELHPSAERSHKLPKGPCPPPAQVAPATWPFSGHSKSKHGRPLTTVRSHSV